MRRATQTAASAAARECERDMESFMGKMERAMGGLWQLCRCAGPKATGQALTHFSRFKECHGVVGIRLDCPEGVAGDSPKAPLRRPRGANSSPSIGGGS